MTIMTRGEIVSLLNQFEERCVSKGIGDEATLRKVPCIQQLRRQLNRSEGPIPAKLRDVAKIVKHCHERAAVSPTALVELNIAMELHDKGSSLPQALKKARAQAARQAAAADDSTFALSSVTGIKVDRLQAIQRQ